MSDGFQPLEARRLLSAELPWTPVIMVTNTIVQGIDGSAFEVQSDRVPSLTLRGTLVIHGSSASERISIDLHAGKVRVYLPDFPRPAAFAIDARQVKRIIVEASDGDDRVFVVGSIVRRCTLVGGAGDDVLHGSTGDTLLGGSGNDRLVIAEAPLPTTSAEHPIQVYDPFPEGPALLVGGTGNDTLCATSTDTTVGGAGRDLALWSNFSNTIYDPLPADTKEFARALWADRASGVESFDTLTHYGTREA